jgi:capsular polysaccharide biosynthesis protein
VDNEKEFDKFMIEQGFEIHVMEWMSIKEQANLFNQASVIISPHWAGLTNIVFCQPWATIIELFHPETIFWHYYAMSGSCWLNYIPIVGEIKSNPKIISMDNDMIISIEKLHEKFKEYNI